MASKAAPLKTSTNSANKRAVDVTDAVPSKTTKKLKSHTRTMSTEVARRILKDNADKENAQNKIIRTKQKEIRDLKKKIKEAEEAVAKAKAAKGGLDTQYIEAMTMAQTDAEIILSKFRCQSTAATGKKATRTYISYSEKLGRDAMDDMLSLGNDADILTLASRIGELGKESPIKGAIKSLLDVSQSSPVRIKALKTMYTPFLKGIVQVSELEMWPLLASAVTVCAKESPSESPTECPMLVKAVLAKAEQMKKESHFQYGRYDASKDKCPILDLLVPTCEAITDYQTGSADATKAHLKSITKDALTKSVNQVETTPNYAMTTEAAIAAKHGNAELQAFLLSPTETVLRLNLTKSGRMAVHRLIDHHMSYGKLRHESEGFGHGRCLVIRKACAEPPEMVQKREERKVKHKELLDDMME